MPTVANSITNDSLRRLGRTIEIGFDAFFDLLILGLKPLFNTIAPEDRRIGVFGHYLENGLSVIETIMKYVASKGFGAVTGEYYYRPNDLKPKQTRDLYPSYLRDLVADIVPTHKWLHEFPRLVSKSIVYLGIMRGQGNEIEGCSDYGIPMLGFIKTDEITRDKNVCNYLVNRDAYTECVCPSFKLCDRVVTPFCPFYDSVHVPWSIKKLFLGKTNSLVAVRNIDDLKPLIDDFLGI